MTTGLATGVAVATQLAKPKALSEGSSGLDHPLLMRQVIEKGVSGLARTLKRFRSVDHGEQKDDSFGRAVQWAVAAAKKSKVSGLVLRRVRTRRLKDGGLVREFEFISEP